MIGVTIESDGERKLMTGDQMSLCASVSRSKK